MKGFMASEILEVMSNTNLICKLLTHTNTNGNSETEKKGVMFRDKSDRIELGRFRGYQIVTVWVNFAYIGIVIIIFHFDLRKVAAWMTNSYYRPDTVKRYDHVIEGNPFPYTRDGKNTAHDAFQTGP